MNKSLKEDLIQELTKFYIQSYEEDKKGNIVYMKRTEFIKKFINFIKEYL